jgi:glucose/arabinose dehydrogenase
MKKFLIGLSIIIGLFIVGAFIFLIPRYNGVKPVLTNPPESIVDLIEQYNQDNPEPASTTSTVSTTVPTTGIKTDFPLLLPEGFAIEVLVKDAPGARVMAFDSRGDLWLSRTGKGTVTFYDIEDGKVVAQKDIFTGLKSPHGLAIRDNGVEAGKLNGYTLYIAEEDKISSVGFMADKAEGSTDMERVTMSLALYSSPPLKKLIDLTPTGGTVRHKSRTIEFGPDGRLYVSIGSSCDVCEEKHEMRGKIFSMKPDGTDWREEARGLRNTVFFTWSDVDGRMWGTDMGRDGLGNDLPPDEINIIEKDKNYGWPICYGQNIHDTDFDKNTYIRNPCMSPFETPAHIDLPAHVAPLGLAFIPEEGWPEAFWYNLLVAEHGSWDSDDPVGYKVVRIVLDSKGNYKGTEDFLSGFLTKDNKALGRPVDIITRPGGEVFISDDHAGVVYRVYRTAE